MQNVVCTKAGKGGPVTCSASEISSVDVPIPKDQHP